ncbi:hypothetical protein SODALDRAFT_357331 [Sodiomyces alkalinus F11]|uniref:Uncharacterized protein n=1 Tax=Sodiomyces alkalinus (strain CBS 110278 / VKM F-3762 / F11) TaxID=1314773 RepID=A0A3N2Q3F1_SODAK|nr:hypothetical protein SODALDRAFT_357331 [Sodiomyces alkalinus F11]ROT41294.1 hypothetical protein SODALDRAFT_357331 [Sodiomyces alkalinus F11]
MELAIIITLFDFSRNETNKRLCNLDRVSTYASPVHEVVVADNGPNKCERRRHDDTQDNGCIAQARLERETYEAKRPRDQETMRPRDQEAKRPRGQETQRGTLFEMRKTQDNIS